MSELPKISQEALYKVLHEKASKQVEDLTTQVTTMELMATALRDERDEARRALEERDATIRSQKEPELVEGEVLED